MSFIDGGGASPSGSIGPIPTSVIVQDLFIAAMEVIGATSLDETPEPSEMQKCLRHANLMLNSWSGRRLLVQATVQESFPLTPNKRQYTIGAGGDFDTAKPINITTAFIRDPSGTDYDVEVVEQQVYDRLSDKMISTGRPDTICYDPGPAQQSVMTGVLSCYSIPDNSYTLFFNSQKYLSQFVNLTDQVTFQPAYYDAIVQNLAMKIWRPMGRQGAVPADIMADARRTMRVIENISKRSGNMRTDLPGGSPDLSDNIMSGGWI